MPPTLPTNSVPDLLNLILAAVGGGDEPVVDTPDGADVTQGSIDDPAVGDADGTVNSHLRYLDKAMGEIQATPTANTLLRRLKDILTGVILAAGENHIGQVGSHLTTIRSEKTRPSDTIAYAANDVINESTSTGSPFTLAACRVGGPGTGVIVGLGVVSTDVTNFPQFEIDIYEQAPATPLNDNVEATHLYVDVGKLIPGPVRLPTQAKLTTNSNCSESFTGCNVPFKAVDLTNIYMRLRPLAGFTPVSAAKYTIVALVLQD